MIGSWQLFSRRTLAVVVVLAVLIFWAWAFSPWARGTHPDTLTTTPENTEFLMRAESLCSEIFPNGEWLEGRAIANIQEGESGEGPRERAVFARKAEELMDMQFVELRKLADEYFGIETTNELLSQEGETDSSETDSGETSDKEIIRKWLTDWESYITDHKAWATKLETGEDAILAFNSVGGARPRGRIEIFTRVNRIMSCQIPSFV